jgi:hypothetical protein
LVRNQMKMQTKWHLFREWSWKLQSPSQ